MADERGRPSIYTNDLADKICNLIATSDKGIKKLCAENDWMPVLSTIFEWRDKHEYFSEQYFKAKARQAEIYADETLEIASEKPYYVDKDGVEKIDSGYVQWQKLNVNTRQWHASKLAPLIYGDKKSPDSDDRLSKKVFEKILGK